MANTITPESIMKLTERLVEEATVREAVFTNTTPLWIGDAFGHTITEHGPHPVAVPTAKAIIGRARWVIKTLASIGKNDYHLSRVEHLASELFGKVENNPRASRYRLIIEVLNTCRDSELYLRRFDVEWLINNLPRNRITETDIKCLQEMINILRCYGYAELLKEMNLSDIADKVSEECGIRENKRFNKLHCFHVTRRAVSNFIGRILERARNDELGLRYLKLLTIPRYYFVVHGLLASRASEECKNEKTGDYKRHCVLEIVRDVLYRMQPLPPRCINVKVRLVRRESRDSDLDDVAWASIYLGLTIFGIGKAASRGFGRFTDLRTNSSDELTKKIKDYLSLICRYVGSSEGSCERVRESALLREVRHPCPIPSFLWTRLQINAKNSTVALKGCGRNKSICKVPCIYSKRRVNTIEGLLSALGHATLKALWKISRSNIKESGKHYHTWVLGLPRFGKKSGHRTGYLLHNPRERNKPEEGRRISTIYLAPLIPSNGSGEDHGVMVILLTTEANDLDTITVDAEQYREDELYYYSVGSGLRTYKVSELMKSAKHPTGTIYEEIKSNDLVKIASDWIIYLLF